jgi:asparagine synthase (glutamine-hydrolysing)
MFRYIIAIGNSHSTSDCEAINGMRRRVQNSTAAWRSAIDEPGVYAAYVHQVSSSDSAIVLPDNRGVIFGSLYQSPGESHTNLPRLIRSISRDQSEDILRSKGRSMVRDYWGYYVAALRYPETSSSLVIRSPVSPLACFRAQPGTSNVFFSNLDDYAALELAPLSINWDSITAQVVGGDYLTNETAIKEISTLECGECAECNPHGCSKNAYWDPRSFLQEKSLDSFSEATQAIRNTTEYCVSALSSSHSHILVNLSGGLDSSIVLSSLSRSHDRPSITAVNYYSRGAGDERRFARSMAHAVNCRLVEQARNQLLDLRRFDDCNRTVRPVLNFSAPDIESRNAVLARESKASAIFDGELGDNVFGSHPSPGALVECVRRVGLGRQFVSFAADYAMLTRQSLWQTLVSVRRAHRSLAGTSNFSSSREMQRRYGAATARSLILASPEAEEHCSAMGDRFVHPWLKQSPQIAPGSQMLLFGLIVVTSTSYHSPFSDPSDPPQVSPLISQPLAEVALRIPAYLHFKFAQDRSVARAAFADALPAQILQRGLGKGGPTLWVKDVVESNCEFLRDFLLNGILVQRRLVDRNKLETTLSPRIAKSTVIVGDIFAKLYIEAWLRKWH